MTKTIYLLEWYGPFSTPKEFSNGKTIKLAMGRHIFAMTYEEKYQELVELSHSDDPKIKEKADAWLISIGLQEAAELKVSAFLLDLAIINVKGEITRDEVTQRLKEHYGNHEYIEPRSGLDGGYDILPPDSPRIKEIEEYSRKLRPSLYAELDKNKDSKNLKS